MASGQEKEKKMNYLMRDKQVGLNLKKEITEFLEACLTCLNQEKSNFKTIIKTL